MHRTTLIVTVLIALSASLLIAGDSALPAKLQQMRSAYIRALETEIGVAQRTGKVETEKAVQAELDLLAGTSQRYVYVPVNVSWPQAKRIAESMGGRLAVIASDADHAKIMQACNKQTVWVGASSHNGKWKWLDERMVPAQVWGSGQPDNAKGIEHFAILNYKSEGLLWDVPADYAVTGFVVELR